MNTTILGVALMLIICRAGGVCMFLVAHQTWKQETTTRESLNETLDDNNSIELWLGSPARASIFAYLVLFQQTSLGKRRHQLSLVKYRKEIKICTCQGEN